jgi:hypothetical protein
MGVSTARYLQYYFLLFPPALSPHEKLIMNVSLSSAARAVALGAAVAAAPLYAQTVVTPANMNGWVLFDGAGPGTDPATISSAQPYNGNGSLQFTVNASNQSPSARYDFGSSVALSGLNSLGFSYLVPTGTIPASSPTIRLLLTGISGVTQPGGRTDGSLGWFGNGATNTWTTQSLSLTSGNFFFRVGGVANEALDCKTTAGSFDDRRQTISAFQSACNGTNGAANLANARITGVEVDFGTFSAPPGQTTYADAVNFSIGSNNGNYNFETAASTVVPEPASVALVAFGMIAVGFASRKRKQQA